MDSDMHVGTAAYYFLVAIPEFQKVAFLKWIDSKLDIPVLKENIDYITAYRLDTSLGHFIGILTMLDSILKSSIQKLTNDSSTVMRANLEQFFVLLLKACPLRRFLIAIPIFDFLKAFPKADAHCLREMQKCLFFNMNSEVFAEHAARRQVFEFCQKPIQEELPRLSSPSDPGSPVCLSILIAGANSSWASKDAFLDELIISTVIDDFRVSTPSESFPYPFISQSSLYASDSFLPFDGEEDTVSSSNSEEKIQSPRTSVTQVFTHFEENL